MVQLAQHKYASNVLEKCVQKTGTGCSIILARSDVLDKEYGTSCRLKMEREEKVYLVGVRRKDKRDTTFLSLKKHKTL